jgi:hypothetical protein
MPQLTHCPDCGQQLDAFHCCPCLSPIDASRGIRFCDQGARNDPAEFYWPELVAISAQPVTA